MNAEQLKQFEVYVKDAKDSLGWDEITMNIDSLLTLLADYQGAQFAAASHIRTVEQQAKIIAGMQAAPIQSGDVREHADTIACMDSWAADKGLPTYSKLHDLAEQYDGVLRSLACWLGAGGWNSEGMIDPKIADEKIRLGIDDLVKMRTDPYPKGDVIANCVCGSWPGGKCLRCPCASTPSAAMQGQGVPTMWMVYISGKREAFGTFAEAERERWAYESGTGEPHEDPEPLYLAVPTPPAAQPQAGGRELTDAKTVRLTMESGDLKQSVLLSRSALDQEASHGTMLHMHVDSMFSAIKRQMFAHITGTKGATE